MRKKNKLGEIPIEPGYITEKRLDNALPQQKGKNKKIGKVLIEMGYINEILRMNTKLKRLILKPHRERLMEMRDRIRHKTLVRGRLDKDKGGAYHFSHRAYTSIICLDDNSFKDHESEGYSVGINDSIYRPLDSKNLMLSINRVVNAFVK